MSSMLSDLVTSEASTTSYLIPQTSSRRHTRAILSSSPMPKLPCSSFFFQAEDGIRVLTVTGVQTCALPIFLTAVRETADDDRALIGAIDRLSRKLRERIGESLTTIRANQPLEKVTTGSLEADRKSVV